MSAFVVTYKNGERFTVQDAKDKKPLLGWRLLYGSLIFYKNESDTRRDFPRLVIASGEWSKLEWVEDLT